MTDPVTPQVITPERQIASQQVGAVFNSLHAFVQTLRPKDADGNPITTAEINNSHMKIEEAAFWAVKSVLAHGTPRAEPKPAPEAEAKADEVAPAEPNTPAEAAPADLPGV